VPAPERCRVEVDPGELDVGDLANDWELVARLLQEENQPVAYQLTELAPLLANLGEVLARDLGEQGAEVGARSRGWSRKSVVRNLW
jgi:hypothetical protein